MVKLTPSEIAAYAARGVSMRIASRTDVGLVRPNNEDALLLGDLATARPSLSSGRIGPAGVLFGVCDGMGGAAAGEIASRTAAQVILQQAAASEVGVEADSFGEALASAVVRAGEAIRQFVVDNPSCRGMGTTCTAAAVRGGLMVVAQVGDSRAYLLRAGQLRQLTTDQTWANEMLTRGRISPEQAATMENGHAITQAVGRSEGLEVELVHLELREGDRILICSDGLSGMVPDAEIARVVAEADDIELASDELLRLALAHGGRDNVSFVLCEFTGKALAAASGLEPEYRLPVKRGRKRVAAAATLVLAVLGAVLWRTAQSPEPRAATTVVGTRNSEVAAPAVAREPARSSDREPERPAAQRVTESDVEHASNSALSPAKKLFVRSQLPPSASHRPVRQERRAKPAPKIETPQEEEIRIIREDEPVAGSPF